MTAANTVKTRLEHGGLAFGFICRTQSAAVVELIGWTGFDFVWIDMEHTTTDFSAVENLCRAADAAGVEPLVRVPDKSQANILRALEAGARIVNIPQVESRAEAEAVVKAAKYHPVGERGYCSSSRGNRYGIGGTVQEIFAAANQRVTVMVQIESARGVQNAQEICSTPGIDVVFVGMGDLSQSLGVPGQTSHPEVLAQTRKTIETARKSGKFAALQVESTDVVKTWFDVGVRLFICGIDVNLLRKTLTRLQSDYQRIVAELTTAAAL
jgi:4-hydroxy-2-oxoheptanedioate aldolase